MSGLDIQYLAELVQQAQEGDSNAFAELFAATYQKQYAFALRQMHDEFLAQQALQNAYIHALGQLTRLHDPSLFVVWLNQMTLRACFALQNAANSESPESALLKIDGGTYSVRQIMTLPFSEAQTLLLSRLCGMKNSAIASLLEIPASDVRRYMAGGCRRIKALSPVKGGKRP